MSGNEVPTYQNYINGQWIASLSNKTYPIVSPANKTSVVGNFQISNSEDTLSAIESASNAASIWANTPAPSRAKVLFKSLEIFERRFEELARAITIEEGKPISDARGEVRRAMNIIEYSAGEGRRLFHDR